MMLLQFLPPLPPTEATIGPLRGVYWAYNMYTYVRGCGAGITNAFL